MPNPASKKAAKRPVEQNNEHNCGECWQKNDTNHRNSVWRRTRPINIVEVQKGATAAVGNGGIARLVKV
jgi:hypothetical protein